MAALTLLLLACDPEPPPTQSTPVGQDGPVRIELGPPNPVKDPVSEAEMIAAYPAIGALPKYPAASVVGVSNLVPAPCEPCDGSLARCALSTPRGCENIPRLIERAVRLAEERDPDQLRAVLSYPDSWLPDETAAQTDAVDVEVWIDPSAPTVAEALERMSAITAAAGDVPVTVHLRIFWDSEEDEELPAALSLLAAEEQAAGRSLLAAGGEAPGVIPDPAIFAARQAEPSLRERLDAEQAVARSKGVRSAPTWFVEGYRLRGLQSAESISQLVQLASEDLPMAPTPETPSP